VEGGVPLLLRPGEHREGVGIRLRKVTPYCIEGTTESDGRPAPTEYSILAIEPPHLLTRDNYMLVVGSTAHSDAEGKYRICGLPPGEYRLTLPGTRTNAPRFAVRTVRVSDRDLRGVVVSAQPGSPLTGRVFWHGTSPDPPDLPKLAIGILPLHRTALPGESSAAHSTTLGDFGFGSLVVDEYQVLVTGVPPGVYVRDIRYGGRSVKASPLRYGSAALGSELQILLARDGGSLAARVTNKDGENVADASVMVVPEGVPSEAALASVLVGGKTDQYGVYTSMTLAPGRYYVLASHSPIDTSPETIGRIWRAYRGGHEVEVGPMSETRIVISRITEWE
jgi:hypothetical protein